MTITCTDGQVPGKVQHTEDPFENDSFHEEAVVVKDSKFFMPVAYTGVKCKYIYFGTQKFTTLKVSNTV